MVTETEVVEVHGCEPCVRGFESLPSHHFSTRHSMAEYLAFNQTSGGSIPSAWTKFLEEVSSRSYAWLYYSKGK